ncbi:MAG: hypothetical protein EOM25_12360 [Deltaproteobacteria bacterium]|nr:hypothetical protein [Deltaproteobacteria bacterium]
MSTDNSQMLTWYSASKLQQVQDLGLRCGHLQYAVLHGMIKTENRYRISPYSRRHSVPISCFTIESLLEFLDSGAGRKMVDGLKNRGFSERPHKPLHKQAKASGIRRKLIELRLEASEAGMSFEDYLLVTGYSEEEIDEFIGAGSGAEENSAEPFPHDDEEGGWCAAMEDLQGLGARLPVRCPE